GAVQRKRGSRAVIGGFRYGLTRVERGVMQRLREVPAGQVQSWWNRGGRMNDLRHNADVLNRDDDAPSCSWHDVLTRSVADQRQGMDHGHRERDGLRACDRWISRARGNDVEREHRPGRGQRLAGVWLEVESDDSSLPGRNRVTGAAVQQREATGDLGERQVV